LQITTLAQQLIIYIREITKQISKIGRAFYTLQCTLDKQQS